MADSIVALLQQGDPVAIAIAVAVVAISVLLTLQLGKGSSKPFLDPQQWKPLTLTRIDQLTHNTKRFVFSLTDPKMLLGLPTGQHITFMAKDSDGKDVYRWGVQQPSTQFG
jgi:cytochrome-b5 reductase